MDLTHFIPNDVAMGDNTYREELVTADLTGTAASVTSASGETDDDSTKTLLLTATDGSGESWDGVEQTVTYPAATDTALEKAAAINDQGLGIHADVDGSGHVVIVTDLGGLGVTIAIGSGTATMVWGTPVAGTGQTATMAKGTLLGRNSSTLKLGAYSDTGSNDLDNPRFVLADELVFSASGDLKAVVFTGGKVNQDNLVKHDDATAIGVAVLDELRINGIEPVKTTDHSVYDNS